MADLTYTEALPVDSASKKALGVLADNGAAANEFTALAGANQRTQNAEKVADLVTQVTVTGGAGATIGAASDAAVVTDTTGTLSGKLRGLVKWAYERMPASLGRKAEAASLPVVINSEQLGQQAMAASIAVTLPSDADGLAADNTAFTAGTTKVWNALAGLYQATVTELTAARSGIARLSARRGIITARDARALVMSSGAPVPSGSDITALSAALVAGDFAIRDTSDHYYTIPVGFAGWNKPLLVVSTLTGAFDQVATVKLYGHSSGLTDPRALLASFTMAADTIYFAIGAGDLGIGGTHGAYVANDNMFYNVPALLAGWWYVSLFVQFGTIPTAGELGVTVIRST